MSSEGALVWFRHDLRLVDNPALQAAMDAGNWIIPVFIWSPDEEAPWQPGAASRWWLHQSLHALDGDLRRHGSQLLLRSGPALPTLRHLIEQSGARSVYWNRRYEPAVIARDKGIKTALRQQGVAVETFNGSLLFEPWTIESTAGKPFQVFTPFWKACLRKSAAATQSTALPALIHPPRWPAGVALASLGLEPEIDWAAGMRRAWTPGEDGANAELERFLGDALLAYPDGRNQPAITGTSRLSPHLHFGEISVRRVWEAVQQHATVDGTPGVVTAAEAYLRELGWREFAHHLLYHFPHTSDAPLRQEYGNFPWRDDAADQRAWQRGRTGYPLVDAGMRELWTTGWMHNRVRMIAASFLVKDLLIPWQVGARWFWDTLVDADLANNTLGWQWTAGCGADAAPFFRVFNPTLQGERFDASGDYVRQWLPELSGMPTRWIHRPWATPTAQRSTQAPSYPPPIVEHEVARARALAAFAQTRRGK